MSTCTLASAKRLPSTPSLIAHLRLPLVAACRLGVHNIHFRHEQSAGFAADAYGKPAVVNVAADCDGTEYSQAWLRPKSGDMYSRGLDPIGPEIRRHFRISPLNALRVRKSAEDNGTQIPLAFIAELTGNSVEELRRVADERQYTIGE